MKKRIAIVGIYHESNTFSSIATTWENFACGHIFQGEQLIAQYKEAHHEIAGFLQGMDLHEVELIPLYFADAIPSGIIPKAVLDRLVAELLGALESVLPSIDGVYAVAHGAAVSEEIRDVDGYWLSQVRKIVGTDMPIVCTLDPHANVSPLMAHSTNAMVAYTKNPHLDQWQTGYKAALLMRKLLFEGAEFKQELIQLPISISIEQQQTEVEPCLSLYQKLGLLIDQKNVCSHSIILGFPYADVHEMGSSVILISRKDFKSANLRKQIMHLFEQYCPQFTAAPLFVEKVLMDADTYPKPVLLLDMGDNVGAGAKGDSSYLLHAIEAAQLTKACIVLFDPNFVSRCSDQQLGDWLTIDLPGQSNSPSARLSYQVQLLERKSGKFTESTPKHGGQTTYDMGQVVLAVTKGGNYIVFTSLRVPPFSSEQLKIFNLDLKKLDWIIAKGVNAPIAAYKEICPVYFKIQTPGESNADATQFNYHYRRKPMFPFEAVSPGNYPSITIRK